MSRLACCSVVLIMVQASCGERRPPALDSAADGSSLPRDSGGGRDGPAQRDQLSPTDSKANHALFAALYIKQFYADCMPAVPPDPVQLSGHVELLNNGTTAVGPIQFTGGTITWPTGGVVATFGVKPIAAFVIKPGEGLSPQVEKVPGSLKAASACGLCGKAVRVELAFGGAGLPTGSKVSSSEIALSCAY